MLFGGILFIIAGLIALTICRSQWNLLRSKRGLDFHNESINAREFFEGGFINIFLLGFPSFLMVCIGLIAIWQRLFPGS